MKPFIAPDLLPVLPELILAAIALLLLVFGVVRQSNSFKAVSQMSIVALVLVGVVTLRFFGDRVGSFGGMYVTDQFTTYMKILTIAGSAFALFMTTAYAEKAGINRFEYPVLVLLSTLGMLLMISANSLMSLYMALELQSLPLYVLAAIQRDHLKSTEAGLKYFVLGALSSGMLLYGSSLIYGYTGSVDFTVIANSLSGLETVPAGVVIGMVLLLSGLAFKVAAVPFHMWSPDVYEGAPTSVTAFFAMAPKMAAVALLARVLAGPFGGVSAEWQQVIIALAAGSMALGAVAGVIQTNIKRLLAYSSISHIGYVLVGLAAMAGASGASAIAATKSVLVYMTVYLASTAGAFAVVLMMKKKGEMVESISDLAGLSSRQPVVAAVMTVLMFSMAGIPPFAGFFAKLFVFQAAVNAGLYSLAVFGVVTSVVSAYYYIRIIKVMYFDAADDVSLDAADDTRLNLAAYASTAAVTVFAAVPAPVLGVAAVAAAGLFK